MTVSVGLIGSGFIGKVHALAYRAAPAVFRPHPAPRLALLADVDDATAVTAAAALGFDRCTGDWRTLVADPDIDVVTSSPRMSSTRTSPWRRSSRQSRVPREAAGAHPTR